MPNVTVCFTYLFLVYKSCAELHDAGFRKSGIYMIKYKNSVFNVYCDQDYKKGGKGDSGEFKVLPQNTQCSQ